MIYYKDNNNVVTVCNNRIKGNNNELIEITEDEAIELFEIGLITLKTSIGYKIAEAKAYLASTDFYMTVDKYAELDEARKVELSVKRAEVRELINTLESEVATDEP